MVRLAVFALLGLGLCMVSGPAAGQDKKEGAETGPAPRLVGVQHVVIDGTAQPISVVSYRLSFPEMVFAFLVLFSLVMIFFQLLLVRSTLEKILERQGGTP